MNTKHLVIFITIILLFFINSCELASTSEICVYGIDSLTHGADGKSFRTSFDKKYLANYEDIEPGFIHIDYATSKDLDIGYRKSSGLKNMASEDDYSIDPVKYSISGRGIYGFNLLNEEFTYTIKNKPFIKVRIYYLQRPDGGSFKYKLGNEKGKNSFSQSMKGELGIKYVELDKSTSTETTISVSEINGNAAFYGAWYFNSETPGASVLNIAKGGMTLSKVMTLDSEFRQYWYAQFKPKLVLFNAGTNDRLEVNGGMFKNLLNQYINDVLVATSETNFVIVEPNQTADYKRSFAIDYTIKRNELAKEKKLKVLDLPKLIGDYEFFIKNDLMLDGVHPNEAGFELISKVTLDFLKQTN
tara:strand:+ start:1003 stop:2076 length:1074 start_codon:yes stop_codon:yes gene_type:complete